jgi:hypothetical protein
MPLHRLVFFIGGFDPKSARFYHRLYRAAASARPRSAAGEQVEVGSRFSASAEVDAWDVRWQAPGAELVKTRYAVLRWDDIVRRHWARTLRSTLLDYWRVYGLTGAHGMFRRIHRDAPAACWMALLPLAIALACLLLAGVLAGAAGALGLSSMGLATLAALPAWLLLWRGVEARVGSEWLLRLYGFTWLQSRDRVPELEQRLDAWAAQLVRQAAANPAQEILLVAHSTGTILVVSVLARALALAPWLGKTGPALSLLTLGHCVPILEQLPQAQRFRAELQRLGGTPGLSWVDLSAPADWAAFARTPPWRQAGQAHFVQASPRFHTTLSAAHYARLLRHRHELHLQYLKAPDRASGYDPVRWTAGPGLLSDRSAELSPTRPA